MPVTNNVFWVIFYSVRATLNVIKNKMTGRVDIPWCIFEKSTKKLKTKSQDREKK